MLKGIVHHKEHKAHKDSRDRARLARAPGGAAPDQVECRGLRTTVHFFVPFVFFVVIPVPSRFGKPVEDRLFKTPTRSHIGRGNSSSGLRIEIFLQSYMRDTRRADTACAVR